MHNITYCTNAARKYFFLRNSDILIVWKEHGRIVIHILNFDLYLGRIMSEAIISSHSQCVLYRQKMRFRKTHKVHSASIDIVYFGHQKEK